MVQLGRNTSADDTRESRTSIRTSSDIISLPIQTAYYMRPDSSDVMYEITVLGRLEFVAVWIRILGYGSAVMRQNKVIGLK